MKLKIADSELEDSKSNLNKSRIKIQNMQIHLSSILQKSEEQWNEMFEIEDQVK